MYIGVLSPFGHRFGVISDRGVVSCAWVSPFSHKNNTDISFLFLPNRLLTMPKNLNQNLPKYLFIGYKLPTN